MMFNKTLQLAFDSFSPIADTLPNAYLYCFSHSGLLEVHEHSYCDTLLFFYATILKHLHSNVIL